MTALLSLMWEESYGSVTIDGICQRAGVKKGSFYYFFESKADLALAAIDVGWNRIKPELDALFSASVPPLERLRKYCEYSYRFQGEIKAKCGHVLGCPQFSLGSEVSTQENRLPGKIQEILECKRKYFESAIRDAHSAGLIDAPDAAAKSRTLFAYYEGLLTQARIQNNLEVLREAERGTCELLGVRETESASVESN